MRVLREATEAEMVATFLRAEINSARWGETLLALLERDGIDRQVVDTPDMENAEESAYRARLLGDFRGYGQKRELFANYPEKVVWNWVALSRDELAHIRYIDYSYWNDLSSGTRLASVAAENIRQGITSCGVPNDRFWNSARALENGITFPELILVGPDHTACVLLEGHLRLTAYLLAPHHAPDETIVLWGTAREFANW